MTKKEKIDTMIISDLHLGAHSSKAKELVVILLSYDFKRLILNGDIFDDFNFRRLNSEQWKILSIFRRLSKKCEVVWISGNHDGDALNLSRLIGVKVFRQYIW